MPSGSFSKRARNIDSLVNKKNCGGNKKDGLSPRTGKTVSAIRSINKRGVTFKLNNPSLPCPIEYSNNPGGQCSGGVGSPASTRNRGCRNYNNNIKDSRFLPQFQKGIIHPHELANLNNPNHFMHSHTLQTFESRGLGSTLVGISELPTTVNWSTTENILQTNMIGSPADFDQARCGCCYLYATTWAILTLYNIKKALIAGALQIGGDIDYSLVPAPVVPNYHALVLGSTIVGIGEDYYDSLKDKTDDWIPGGCNGGWIHWTISVLANEHGKWGSGLLSENKGIELGYKSNEEFTKSLWNKGTCKTNCCTSGNSCSNCKTQNSYGCGRPAWASQTSNNEIITQSQCNTGIPCLNEAANPDIDTRASGNISVTDNRELINIFTPDFQPGFFKGTSEFENKFNDEGSLVHTDPTVGITIVGFRTDKALLTNQYLQNYLNTVGPVPIGIFAESNNFTRLNSKQYWLTDSHILGPVQNKEPDHIVQIIGYTTISDNSPLPPGATVRPPNGQYWIIHNQWGRSWGLNNTCFLRASESPLDAFFMLGLMNTSQRTVNGKIFSSPGIINTNFDI